jgi:hypothetical protein
VAFNLLPRGIGISLFLSMVCRLHLVVILNTSVYDLVCFTMR